jgi:hypothetical protein
MSKDRTFTCHGSSFLPVSLLILLAFGVPQLPAQTPIYSLPFFILFPAKYRLAKNLTYDGKEGSAIMILSSDVDLDLNGCALKETAPDNQSIGVLIDHQQNVTIRNGKIQGFKQAIVVDDHTKRIAWPGNDLASRNVAIQSVEASPEAPVDVERKPRTAATSEQPKSTPTASPTPEISDGFLDRYDATKSSPRASPSSAHRRHRKEETKDSEHQ